MLYRGSGVRLIVGICGVRDADPIRLYETAHAQVLLDNDVVHGGHDEADLHRVGGAGEVCVDLLGGMLVETVVFVSKDSTVANMLRENLRDESVEDVVACRAVVLATLVVGEVVLHR